MLLFEEVTELFDELLELLLSKLEAALELCGDLLLTLLTVFTEERELLEKVVSVSFEEEVSFEETLLEETLLDMLADAFELLGKLLE